ncbi:flagellar protein [Paenibacillus rigui]|uniref:Flagellar protein n=1 Tax=Paenibacillus rigui TaxID=554312 RepID=A0A229UXQ5_9BACL|nr:flagellar protein [Paenibacillus rigui]
MSILAVANCPCCGKVYQKNLRNLCMDCIRVLENEYDECYAYLRTHRRATTEQLSSATGVSVRQIFSWIKAKRLSINDYPNLTYPCDSCGDPIKHQKLCFACSTRLTRDIRELQTKDSKVYAIGIGYRSRLDR